MTDKTLKVLMQAFGDDWKNKCERSLLLAKNLGNIYTGSLYNGLLSLIGDTSIDLKGKKIMMFSYGSGCAASMFMVHVKGDYKNMQKASEFKTRLQNRIKVSPEDFDQLMAYREKNFGRHNYEP
jgi:hydroxymethylglutaryl-CoA synthase